MPDFQVFAKPVGPQCNLYCDYCYYRHNPLPASKGLWRMDDAMLELYIRQHMEATKGPLVFFSWHGGEPLMAGLDFYRRAVSLQQKWKVHGQQIINGIQTNGTLIDENWAGFFAQENFQPGISLDGPQPFHDRFRVYGSGSGSFRDVLRGYDLAVMNGLDPEILCVLNAENVLHPLEIYRFFKNLGVTKLTFLPLVNRIAGGVDSRSVQADDFGEFLCAVFDEWVTADIGKVQVQIFEETLRSAFHQEHTLCIFRPVCGRVPVVEHNGDFYSCDHFVDPDHLAGNIGAVPLADLLNGERQKAFGQAKYSSLPRQCLECEVLEMCHGECPKNRFIYTDSGQPGLNYLCSGYRNFFNHAKPFVEAVALEYNKRG